MQLITALRKPHLYISNTMKYGSPFLCEQNKERKDLPARLTTCLWIYMLPLQNQMFYFFLTVVLVQISNLHSCRHIYVHIKLELMRVLKSNTLIQLCLAVYTMYRTHIYLANRLVSYRPSLYNTSPLTSSKFFLLAAQPYTKNFDPKL